jgi:hypothetical protein
MAETISVPVTLESLSAAICSRVEVLTPDSSTDDLWAVVGLVRKLETTLDRLAMEFEPDSINTVADVSA